MKNKVYTASKLYICYIIISIISYSCCDDTYRIVGKGTFLAFDFDDRHPMNETNSIDTITGTFLLLAQYEVILTSADTFKTDFTTSAYATSCDEDYSNFLLKETLNLHTNKDFTFDGSIIPANSNLLDIPEIYDAMQFGRYSDVQIEFNADFLDKANFEKDEYIFNIYLETNDGLQLENQVVLMMDL